MEELIELRPPVFIEPPNSALLADVYESANEYVIQVAVPGLKPEEITIEIDTYSITVHTKPEPIGPNPNRKYIVCEHPLLPLTRTFNFPFAIDRAKLKTSLSYGMLLICVPKPIAGERKNPAGQAT